VSHSVLVVDDEPPARAKLARFLQPLPEFELVAEAGSVDEAIAAINTHQPAIVYLDIQLGTRSGFDVLEAISGSCSPHVVFTTAYSEYAVKAFDIQALDYLLKPYDRERFLQSVQRVRDALSDPDHGDLEERVRRIVAGMPGRPAPLTQVLVRDKTRAYFLPVESIERLCAAGNYVEVHAGGKLHLIREPLSKFVTQLNPEEFIRVHRSHVVRVSFIAELHAMFSGDYELVLRNGERVALSRRYKALLPASIRERL
jgi:two-component system, LytTR family, response regulator